MDLIMQNIDLGQKPTSVAFAHVKTKTQSLRLSAIDVQRGLIMVLMAFVHSREYLGLHKYGNVKMGVSPKWLGESWFDVFYQLVEPLAAGGFFLTMGIGIYFLWQARKSCGWQAKKITHYLFTRGALMVILQLTILHFFEYLSSPQYYFYIGVLMSLGFCMMGAACCMLFIDYLQNIRRVYWSADVVIPLAGIAIIVFGTQWAMYHIDVAHVTLGQMIAFVGGHYMTPAHIDVEIDFTPLPWFSATLFGLVVGKILYQNHQQGIVTLQKIVIGMLIAWFILRTGLLAGWFTFGDYKLPHANETLSIMSYWCFTKYPPSLGYYLWVLAINLQGIILWSRVENYSTKASNWLKPLKLFGQCALFFFLCHWFVYFGLSLLLNEKLTTPMTLLSGWLVGLIILYPLCKLFNRFKSRQEPDSFWRLL